MTVPPTTNLVLSYGRRSPLRRHLWKLVALTAAVMLAAVLLYYRNDLKDWATASMVRRRILVNRPSTTVAAWQYTSDIDKDIGILRKIQSRFTHRDPLWLEAQGTVIPLPSATPGAMTNVLLCELKSPATQSRVVSVQVMMTWTPKFMEYGLEVRLFEPGTFLHPHFTELTLTKAATVPEIGIVSRFPGKLVKLGDIPWGNDFTLSHGHIDPDDPSRFLLDYSLNGVHGTVWGSIDDTNALTLGTMDGKPLPVSPR